jgi:hypothetical protein
MFYIERHGQNWLDVEASWRSKPTAILEAGGQGRGDVWPREGGAQIPELLDVWPREWGAKIPKLLSHSGLPGGPPRLTRMPSSGSDGGDIGVGRSKYRRR